MAYDLRSDFDKFTGQLESPRSEQASVLYSKFRADN
jgi:hypothetical protein